MIWMKLKIISRNTSDFAVRAAIREMGKTLSPGAGHIVIVPDKFTLSFEKEIFEELHLEGSLDIDVVTFSRLAYKELGSRAKKCMSKQGAVLVLKKVIDKNTGLLRHYGKAAGTMSFAKELYAVIASIRSNGYLPQDIEEAIPSLYRTTASKMSDIALLYRAYMEEIEGRYEDSSTRLLKFTAMAEESERIGKSRVHIVGFPSFSAQQYDVIKALLKRAQSVTVSLCAGNGGRNAYLYPLETADRLKDIGKECNILAETDIDFEEIPGPFGTLSRELFAYGGGRADNSLNAVRIFKEKTVFDEINAAALEINRQIRREGKRYRDIAILSCNESYNSLISSVFLRYGIPCFVDERHALTESAPYRYVLAAIEAALYHLRKDKAVALIKSPLFGLPPPLRFSFENTVLKYNFTFNAFRSPFTFEGGEEAETVRQKLLAVTDTVPLSHVTAAAFSQSIKDILQSAVESGAADAYLKEIGEDTRAAANASAIDKLIEVADEIKDYLGEGEYSLSALYDIFKSSAGAVEFSLLPRKSDSVFVGGLRDGRFNGHKTLFALFATSDNLPAVHSYQAIISAADSEILEGGGIRLFPTPEDLLREEEYLFADFVSKPSERLFVSYSEAAPDGGALSPSPVIADLKAILSVKESSSLRDCFLPEKAASIEALEDALSSPSNAYFQTLTYLNKVSYDERIGNRNLNTMYSSLLPAHKEEVVRLLNPKEKTFTPPLFAFMKKNALGQYLTNLSELESYFACPYRHFLKCAVGLKEREEAQIGVIDVGIIIHTSLELYFKRTLGKLDALDKRETEETALLCAEEAICLETDNTVYRDGLSTVLLERLKKECVRASIKITENLLKTEFRPVLVEQEFGMRDKNMPGIEIAAGEETFLLRGKIDRVDAAGKLAYVVDYKTGRVDTTEREHLKNLYYGLKMQPYLYLTALSAAGYTPVGAFYLPVNDRYGKDRQAEFRLEGLMINDRQTAEMFDKDVYTQEVLPNAKSIKSTLVPLTLKIRKGCERTANSDCLPERFMGYLSYAADVIRCALNEIRGGHIEKAPADKWDSGPCDNCAYSVVCAGSEKKIRKVESVTPLYKTGEGSEKEEGDGV